MLEVIKKNLEISLGRCYEGNLKKNWEATHNELIRERELRRNNQPIFFISVAFRQTNLIAIFVTTLITEIEGNRDERWVRIWSSSERDDEVLVMIMMVFTVHIIHTKMHPSMNFEFS